MTTQCPTCKADTQLRVTRVSEDHALVTCPACDTTLTLAELVSRAYLRGYEQGLADVIAEFRDKEARRNAHQRRPHR